MTSLENKKFVKNMLDITRHNLGVISMKTIIDVHKLDKGDRRNYIAAAHDLFLNPVFVNEIKNLALLQKDFTVMEAENERQSDFGRGTINGIALLYERIARLNNEYESFQRERSGRNQFDPQHPIAEED